MDRMVICNPVFKNSGSDLNGSEEAVNARYIPIARTIRNAGFKIISQAFQVNDTFRFSARMCMIASSNSLVSIPIK